MVNEKAKHCKTQDCNNPVLNGKYCLQCKKKRKETKNKVLIGGGSVVIPVIGVAIKKGALKQIPKIASKVIQAVLRK